MLSHLNITLYGTVHGVFLRRTVEHEAQRRDVFGFVRNEPDGTVYIEAEGDEEKLQHFVVWLKEGAGSADTGAGGDYKITQVDVEPGQFKAYDSFEIR